jgi:hypothetical protein
MLVKMSVMEAEGKRRSQNLSGQLVKSIWSLRGGAHTCQ